MKKIIVIVLLLAGTVGAQSANVIELRPGDADRAKKSWEALQLAQADWESVQKAIGSRYVYKAPCVASSSGVWPPSSEEFCIRNPKEGFENGFEFSKDFKYIVPKAVEQTPKFNFYGTVPAMGQPDWR